MNLHIRQLLESLFDDEQDDILDDDTLSEIVQKTNEEDIIKWFTENTSNRISNYQIKFEKGKNIFFEYDNIEDYSKTNVIIKIGGMTQFNINKTVPKNIHIISINAGLVTFNNVDLTNMCDKVEGDLLIQNCNDIIDFNNVGFPKEVTGEFILQDCDNIISFEGLKEKCCYLQSIEIKKCNKLISTKGIPEIDSFIVFKCDSFKKLEDFPEETDYISLFKLPEFSSLKGISKKVKQGLYLSNCPKLKTLKYSPKFVGTSYEVLKCGLVKLEMQDSNCKVVGTFDITGNKLTTLENGPKEVTYHYKARENNLIKLNANNTTVSGITAKFDVRDNNKLKEISMFNDVPIGISDNQLMCDKKVIIQ